LIDVIVEKFLSFLAFNVFNEMLLEGPFEIKAFSQEVFCFCQRDAFGDEMVGLFIEEVIKFFKKICCKA